LRMIGKPIQHDREHAVGKTLDHVPDLQVVLAIAVGREPPGSRVVAKRIVESLRHLVAERGNVAEAPIEKAWRDPARVVQDITPLLEAVGGAALLEIVSVEPEDAAVVGITAGIEIGVWKQKRGNIAGANVTRGFRGANRRGGVRPGKRRGEKRVKEGAFVNQNKGAAGAVGVEGEAIRAADEHHGPGRPNTRAQQGVPVIVGFMNEFGPLDSVVYCVESSLEV